MKTTHRLLMALTLTMLATAATAAEGLIILKSPHAAGAAKVDKAFRPTEVLIFGNPQGGTPFMECPQTLAAKLAKALAGLAEATVAE